jgi:hypothetical protein
MQVTRNETMTPTDGAEHTTVVHESVTPLATPHWVTTHLRALIALTMTGVVSWCAVRGDRDAIVALMGAFSVLMGSLWGERAALKQPGKDS